MRRMIDVGVQPQYAAARAGDVRDSQADITKARELLGYEPRVSFEEGLQRTIDWYRTAAATA
jgi:nucleoside-diphosphate-sugar epimerase